MMEHLHGPLAAVGAALERIRWAVALQAGAEIPACGPIPAAFSPNGCPARLRDHIPDRYIAACNG
jgi:hypothetical protein